MDRSRLRRRAATVAVLGALAASSIASGAVTPPPIGDLGTFQVTTYWFVPETSFVGTRIKAPGLTGLYREDFLYSSRGVDMEGTGTGLDGRTIHWDGTTGGYWVNRDGVKTVPTRKAGAWTHGSPYWREGGWRNAEGRPTFRLTATTWSNGAGKTHLPYHDTFALGPGVPVTPWHSIATDLKVIPRGSKVYVEALRDSPAQGCFSADDTGGAIIGKHIDVLVPFDTPYVVPETSRVVVLAPTDLCPPLIAPTSLGTLTLDYVHEATASHATARQVHVPGMAHTSAAEDVLYAPAGTVWAGVGTIRPGTRIVSDGGGWWVNRRGRRTTRSASGQWTHGAPFWRDGGWRNAHGAPTYRRQNGHWSNGVGRLLLPYHDRFHLAATGERPFWQSGGASRRLVGAALGAILHVDALPSIGCVVVDHHVASWPALEILVPADVPLAGLPTTSPVTLLPADAAPAACAA